MYTANLADVKSSTLLRPTWATWLALGLAGLMAALSLSTAYSGIPFNAVQSTSLCAKPSAPIFSPDPRAWAMLAFAVGIGTAVLVRKLWLYVLSGTLMAAYAALLLFSLGLFYVPAVLIFALLFALFLAQRNPRPT